MKHLFIAAGIVLLLLIFSCTSNPFFEDNVAKNNKLSLSGKVKLSDGSRPEGVYVWLSGLDISARTDENGLFTLTLPSPALQPGGGVTGVFRLYYYVGNYRVTFSSVLLRNGYFEYGSEDLNDKGTIKKTITLIKMLDIQTSIASQNFLLADIHCVTVHRQIGDSVFTTDSCWAVPNDNYLNIDITLTNLVPSVKVQSYKTAKDTAACIIFRKTGAPVYESYITFSRPYTGLSEETITHTVKWTVKMPWYYLPYEAGVFFARPFILVEQEGLPDGLLNSFGKHAGIATGEYLQVPYFVEADSVWFNINAQL